MLCPLKRLTKRKNNNFNSFRRQKKVGHTPMGKVHIGVCFFVCFMYENNNLLEYSGAVWYNYFGIFYG